MLYKARVPVDGLSDEIPEVDTTEIDYNQFIINAEEETQLNEIFKHSVTQSWHELVDLSTLVIAPPNKYAKEMRTKTEKVNFL